LILTRISKNKKGQVWTVDFILGLVLFILTLILGIKIILDTYSPTEYNKTYRDAVHLSDAIVSSGYPSGWDSSNVVIPGVAENNRINTTKLDQFSDLNYSRAKSLLHVQADFIFFIRNSTHTIDTGECIYGFNLSTHANCTPILLDSTEYENLVKLDRTVIYNSTIMVMTFYVWD